MTVAAVAVTLRQPTTLGGRPVGGTTRHTHTFVPGSTLRGAFAAAWIARHGAPQSARRELREEFERLFEGGIIFRPLFAGGPPLPMSVMVHKRDPQQFVAKHPLTWDCATENLVALGTGGASSTCPTSGCGVPLEMSKGRIVDAPAKRRDMHVARSRENGQALEGQLFATEVIAAPESLTMRGEMLGDPRDLALLAQFTRISVGGSRSVQGAADVALTWSEESHRPVVERLLNQKNGNTRSNSVILRLISSGIFVDDFGRPCGIPNYSELAQVLGIEIEEVLTWPGRPRWVVEGGWHAVSGLPKPEERAVAAGSTYAVLTKGSLSEDAARRLLLRGVGLRRHEGFGALAFAVEVPEPSRRGAAVQSPDAPALATAAKAEWAAKLAGRTGPALYGELAALLAARASGESVPQTNFVVKLLAMASAPAALKQAARWATVAPLAELEALIEEHRP